MPLTSDDKRVENNFRREYGDKRGKSIFYASINSGRVKNIPEARRLKNRNRRKSR